MTDQERADDFALEFAKDLAEEFERVRRDERCRSAFALRHSAAQARRSPVHGRSRVVQAIADALEAAADAIEHGETKR